MSEDARDAKSRAQARAGELIWEPLPEPESTSEVPVASRRAFAEQHGLTPPGEPGRPVDWDRVDEDIRKIAVPMVLVELRDIAAGLRERAATCRAAVPFGDEAASGWTAAAGHVDERIREIEEDQR